MLPFLPQRCNPKQEVEAPKPDSTFVSADTLKQHSSTMTQENQQLDTLKAAALENSTLKATKPEGTNDENELSAKLSKKSPVLKILLRPNDNYTGIASLIDCISFLEFGYGLGIAFILWLIALIIKIKDFNNIFVLINIIGLVFLSLSHSLNVLNNSRLWGFWICLIWSMTMIIYDCIILFKIRNG